MLKCTKQVVEVKRGLNQRYVLWKNACSIDINIYAVLWNMHTSKPWDCGDKPLNKLKVYLSYVYRIRSFLPILSNPGFQKRGLSIPMVPLPTNERRDQC